MEKPDTNQYSLTTKDILRFVIPSLIGVIIFLCPIKTEGGATICLNVILDAIRGFLGFEFLSKSAFVVIVAAAVISLLTWIFKPKCIVNNSVLNSIFNVEWYWTLTRVLGGIFATMVMFNFGPEFIISPDTGGFTLFDLISGVLPLGIVTGATLPLLIEFGLLEFVGTFFGKVFNFLFKIPGRAAIDCVSSWVGDLAVGILMTNNQYENGYYNAREACVIATTFSTVSIAFALVILEQIGLNGMFFQFYGGVVLVGIICAIIMPRIPPLSRKPNEFTQDCGFDRDKLVPDGISLPKWALIQATTKAKNNGYTPKKYLTDWAKNTLTIMFALNVTIMSIGTIALIIAYYTPILDWLGMPFVPILKFMGMPEAEAAAATILSGFTDMFIPAVLAGGTIDSTFTKMFVGILSICQLIYMSETGPMILGSSIPVKFSDLVIIFLERTVIIMIFAPLVIRFVLGIPMV